MEGWRWITAWRGELDEWLAPFVAAFRHKTRGRMCPAYIAGLIGPGDRKSIQPMAARDSDVSYDRLHQFITSGVWDGEALYQVPLTVKPVAEGGTFSGIELPTLRGGENVHWAGSPD